MKCAGLQNDKQCIRGVEKHQEGKRRASRGDTEKDREWTFKKNVGRSMDYKPTIKDACHNRAGKLSSTESC